MQLSAFLGVLLSGGSIIDLDGTVFVQLGMFFVAFLLLHALVFKPMVALLDAREQAIDGAKDEAKHLEQEVKDKQAMFESELRKVRGSAGEERERLRAEGLELERKLLKSGINKVQKKQEWTSIKVMAAIAVGLLILATIARMIW